MSVTPADMLDACVFAQRHLGFTPDPVQAAGAGPVHPSRDSELHAAVGQEHGDGGEGAAPGAGRSRRRWCWWRVRARGRAASLCVKAAAFAAAAETCGCGATGNMRFRCCFRTDRGLWGCRGRSRRCAGFRIRR